MTFTSYLYYLPSSWSSRAIWDSPACTLGEGNGKKRCICSGHYNILSFHAHMPQHSDSVCLQSPLFIPVPLRDVMQLVSGQPRVPETLATLSSSVQVDGIWRQLDLALWLGSFLKLGQRQYAYTGRWEGEEGFSVGTAVFSPNAFP